MIQEFVSLPTGEKIRLEYGKHYANLHVYYENQFLGAFKDKASLKIGRRFSLPNDESIIVILLEQSLAVWYKNIDLITELASGEPMPPQERIDDFLGYGCILTGIAIFLEIRYYFVDDPQMKALIPWFWFIAGIILPLGILRHFFRSDRFLIGSAILIILVSVFLFLFFEGFGAFLLLNGLILLYNSFNKTKLRKRQIRKIEPDSPLDDGF
jgi:hypothetical protein